MLQTFIQVCRFLQVVTLICVSFHSFSLYIISLSVLDEKQVTKNRVLVNLFRDAVSCIADVGLKELLNSTQHGQPYQEIVLISLYSHFHVV